MIGTRTGVVRAWAVKRKVEEQRWDITLIKDMKGTPAKPDPASSGIEIPVRICLPKETDEEEEQEWRKPRREDKPRRTYLKKEDFEVHGYTEGCKGCRWIQTGIGQPGHDETCRKRMEDNLRKEEHPRFQRANDARSSHVDDQAEDYKRMTDEELAKATEDYLQKNPDTNRELEGTTATKRKGDQEEVNQGKVQKTEAVDEQKNEEEQRLMKRDMEYESSNTNRDKRIRLDVNPEVIPSEDKTLEMFETEYNIAVLQQRLRQQTRNRQYDVKAVARGQVSRLLNLSHGLPDVNIFHDTDKMKDVSSCIAWDDLTGMKLEAGKVKEARTKEMAYIKDKRVWTKIPRQVALAKGWKIIKTRWIDINKGDDEQPIYRSGLG